MSRIRRLRGPSVRGVFVDPELGGMTADHVYDNPRQPDIEPLGVLDARGVMLCRVTVPVKQRLGFVTGPGWGAPVEDSVCDILPEDLIQVSHGAGVGIDSVQTTDLEDCDE